MENLNIVSFALPLILLVLGAILVGAVAKKADSGEVAHATAFGLLGYILIVSGLGWAILLVPWGVMIANANQ